MGQALVQVPRHPSPPSLDLDFGREIRNFLREIRNFLREISKCFFCLLAGHLKFD